jgi:hypothetical protein
MTHVQPTQKIWWLRMLDMKVIAIGFNISDTKKNISNTCFIRSYGKRDALFYFPAV